MKYDVVIIGGGVSGLSCAITIGSATQKFETIKEKKVLVIDAGKSHLNIAQLYNAAGVNQGTLGTDILADLVSRAQSYENVQLKKGTVVSVSGGEGSYVVKNDGGESFEAVSLVFANGMQTIDVEGIGSPVIDHVRAPRPGMVMIKNENGVIGRGKYVTGCAAGATSMFTAAAGYGSQTATDIISEWIGKYSVPHDVAKKN